MQALRRKARINQIISKCLKTAVMHAWQNSLPWDGNRHCGVLIIITLIHIDYFSTTKKK